jgi:hypothetical protein
MWVSLLWSTAGSNKVQGWSVHEDIELAKNMPKELERKDGTFYKIEKYFNIEVVDDGGFEELFLDILTQGYYFLKSPYQPMWFVGPKDPNINKMAC